MMMNKIIFLCLFLVGCNDFSFGVIGSHPKNVTTKPTTTTPNNNVQEYSCTTDEQCGQGLICYKQNSYVGACARIVSE